MQSEAHLYEDYVNFRFHYILFFVWCLGHFLFLVPYRQTRRELLVYLQSIRLSVCLSVCLSVRLSFHLQFSRLFSAVNEDIQLKFDMWLHLNELQTKFEFRYVTVYWVPFQEIIHRNNCWGSIWLDVWVYWQLEIEIIVIKTRIKTL
jgi:hypothetical protein